MIARLCIVVLVTLLMVSSGSAWEPDEHRLLADSVFVSVMRECELRWMDTVYTLDPNHGSAPSGGPILQPISFSFSRKVAEAAADDLARNRFHEYGASIPDQLKGLDSAGNAVAAYLYRHLDALRRAADSTGLVSENTSLAWDAAYSEAIAQGYLADAFSSGHILSFKGGFLSSLQKRNRIEAHTFHRDRGAYVVNGRGDCWQTFGDGLLHWYAPTYRMVFEACRTSLKELLVVSCVTHRLNLPDPLRRWLSVVAPGQTPAQVVATWLAEHDGPAYYNELKMPTLMLMPMPVSATWSHRTEDKGADGVRLRHHYPQLRETGYHDPDLTDIDVDFLYSRESIPEWMIPEPLRTPSPTAAHELIRSNRDWASVRWVQERSAPPSYKGLLLQVGGQVTVGPDDTRSGGTVGVGYGLWDDLLLVKNVSVSATFMPSFHRDNHRLLVTSGGFGVDLPGESALRVLRFDIGLAFGLGEDYDDVGTTIALGLGGRVIPLEFTNAGVTWRARYQWFHLDQALGGPAFELVFQ